MCSIHSAFAVPKAHLNCEMLPQCFVISRINMVDANLTCACFGLYVMIVGVWSNTLLLQQHSLFSFMQQFFAPSNMQQSKFDITLPR